ncbi:MAG TPA: PorV/PorQ family protein, partial [Candidatus Edwardsbacteria bacterium]|nr:PorV/PorQ family protein [Candidatus Edwardsbacteria bacterium]
HVMLCALLGAAAATAVAGEAGFAFLRIPVKARPAAMGEAVVACAADPAGLSYNPGGLPLIAARQASASYLNYVADIQAGNLCYVQPLDSASGVCAGLTYLSSGSIKETTLDDPLGDGLGSFTYMSVALSAGYGRKLLPRLAAGALLKGVYERAKDYTASGVAADLGAIYQVDLQRLGDRIFKPAKPGHYGNSLALGASFQNVGFATKAFVAEKEKMPLTMRAGLAYQPFGDKLTIALAGVKPVDTALKLQAGAEYWIKGIVALRLGYNGLHADIKTGSNTDDFSGLAAGLGARVRTYRLDFGYTPFAGLGNPVRVDISAEF